ncbi:MAG: CDP-alcohol phosphatidyltransferase family protein [Maricaulaceae bacterium]
MTTSTPNDNKNDADGAPISGGIADILTLMRVLLTPVIMFVIIMGWPLNGYAALASGLFIFAAITDFLDDYFGGTETAPQRRFGWFDDIADIILVVGTLLAMAWVIYKSGWMDWLIFVPMAIFIGKELFIGLTKGFELSNLNPIEDKLATAKNALSMLAISVLLASPWLTTWFDTLRAAEDPFAIYNEASPFFWLIGTGLLWLAALVGLLHGFRILQATAHVKDGGK